MKIEKGPKLNNITLRKKVIILIIDYIIIIGIVSILSGLSSFEKDYTWTFRFSIYLLYYFISELLFNRTIGMRLLNVSINGKKRGEVNRPFVRYSLLIFLDRFIFLIVYIFRLLLQSNRELLWSENYSGLRWVKN